MTLCERVALELKYWRLVDVVKTDDDYKQEASNLIAIIDEEREKEVKHVLG